MSRRNKNPVRSPFKVPLHPKDLELLRKHFDVRVRGFSFEHEKIKKHTPIGLSRGELDGENESRRERRWYIYTEGFA